MTIDISKEKLKEAEGKTYNSFSAMCQELVSINGVKCVKGKSLGSYEKAIKIELQRHAEIFIPETEKGKRKPITIIKAYDAPQPPPPTRAAQSDIAEYFRPVLCDMINREYQDNCFIKYHKALTVDLGYMGTEYAEIYKVFNTASKNSVPLSVFGIKDTRGYATHITEKLIGKVKRHIDYYCENLKYNGVLTYKTLMSMAESEIDFMDYADQQLFNEYKQEVKEELEREWEKPNYRLIPRLASEKFNKQKKKDNPKYEPVGLSEIWTFEIQSDFKPIPQATNLKWLNSEILKGFLNSIHCQALLDYKKTQEYKDIKAAALNDFIACDPRLCSNKDVRQALTRNNRYNTAKKRGADESSIGLDFPLNQIESYLNDIYIIGKACEI